MTTATLPVSAIPSRTAPARKGWFSRYFDRVIEARTRQAEAAVREHLRRLPPDFVEQTHLKDAVGAKWSLPFVRGA